MNSNSQVQWKIEGIFRADAERCWEEIQGLGDGVTPEKVVEIAASEDSELHKCFEWDDTQAARMYRIDQARKVIRNIVYVPGKPQQAPVRVLSISSERTVYRPTIELVRDPDEYERLSRRAFNDWEAFKRRYSTIVELREAFDAMDEAFISFQDGHADFAFQMG